jgi:WD40 repeat protein
MSDVNLSSLLARWEEAFEQGRDIPAQELVRDRPELADELARCIERLRSMNHLLGKGGNKQAGLPPAEAPPTVIQNFGGPASPNESATVEGTLTGEDNLPTFAGATPDRLAGLGKGGSRILPPLPAVWPAPPGYQILGELGRGGMGVVYRAKHITLGRIVALKMILSGAYAGENELARFRTEAEALARIAHPNIVQVFEIGEFEGRPYFSLEWCAGGALDRKLKSDWLTPRQTAELVQRLALAMQAAHEARVIHRDLKPANILLAADGTPKITDFGLAKKLDEKGQTATNAVMGTPSYMAPEQAEGKSESIGPSADIYSLGAILYELLASRPPFKAATPVDTLNQVVADEPIPPRRLDPKLPRDLETICLKCLQKDPRKRYASAADLAADLHRFQDGMPILARPISSLERAGKWVRRRPAIAALLAALAVVALSGAGLLAWQYGETVTQRDNAITQEGIAKANEATAIKQEGIATTKAKEAREAAQKLEIALEDSRRELFAARGPLAEAALRDRDVARANDLLDGVPRRFQFWDWAFLKRKATGGLFTLQGHTAAVNAVAVSKDGKRLASAGQDGTVKVWNAISGNLLWNLQGHKGAVYHLAFNPNGRRLASSGQDGTVHVWNVETGKPALVFGAHGEPVHGLAWSPDGQWLASAGDDSTIRMWNPENGAERRVFREHAGPARSVSWSSDGKRIVSGAVRNINDEGEVKIWDAKTGATQKTLGIRTTGALRVAISPDDRLIAAAGDGSATVWDAVTGRERFSLDGFGDVAFSPEGERLATPSLYGTLKIWDAGTGHELHTFTGHTGAINGLAWCPDGQRLASASADKSLKMWDSRTGGENLRLEGHEGGVRGVAWSQDNRVIATAGEDRTVRLWDALGGTMGHTLAGHHKPVNGVAYCPNGEFIASASADGDLRIWNTQNGACLHTLPGHTAGASAIAWSRDGKWLASAGRDKTIRIWDASNGECLHMLTGHSEAVTSVAFHPDSKFLASGSEDRTVRLWTIRTGKAGPVLRGHSEGIAALAFNPEGTRLASASRDRSVKVWNPATGKLIRILTGQASSLNTVAYTPDGQRIAAAGEDGIIKLWDARSGAERLTLSSYPDDKKGRTARPESEAAPNQDERGIQGQQRAVEALAFSLDGQRLAATGADGTVRIYEARYRQERFLLRGHSATVFATAFRPDGRLLATGGEDRLIKVWNADIGKEEQTLRGHTEMVSSLAFNPKGDRLASGSWDKTVKIWDPAKRKTLLTLKGHKRFIEAVGFSSDGSRVIASDGEGDTLSWDAKTGKPLPEARDDPPTPPTALSTDGNHLADPEGPIVRLIDLRPPGKLESGYRQWAERPDRQWHANQAARHERARRWFPAAFHLDRLGPDRLLDSKSLTRRARAHAELGRWQKAAKGFAALESRAPEDAANARYLALTQLAAGNRDAFHRASRRLIENTRARCAGLAALPLAAGGWGSIVSAVVAGDAANKETIHRAGVVHLAVIAPIPGVNYQTLVEWAPSDGTFLQGAILCRAGKFKEAAAKLRSRKSLESHFFFALAECGAKRAESARKAFDAAVKALQARNDPNHSAWDERLMGDLLRSEVSDRLKALAK